MLEQFQTVRTTVALPAALPQPITTFYRCG